jgi:hypothetical protein
MGPIKDGVYSFKGDERLRRERYSSFESRFVWLRVRFWVSLFRPLGTGIDTGEGT